MKQSIPGRKTSKGHKSEVATTRRMLRREFISRTQEQLADISKASNMAEQLEILERYVEKLPVVDPFVKNSIRNAIATGNYTIDPYSIAKKLLKFEEDLYS